MAIESTYGNLIFRSDGSRKLIGVAVTKIPLDDELIKQIEDECCVNQLSEGHETAIRKAFSQLRAAATKATVQRLIDEGFISEPYAADAREALGVQFTP